MLKANYKKIIVPLLVLPFLFSCNNNDAKYKVNEEEYEYALSFEGIDYVQFSATELEEGTDIQQIEDKQLSPTVYSSTSSYKEDKKRVILSEHVVNKVQDGEGWKYWEYDRDPDNPEWSKKEATATDFITPASLSVELKAYLSILKFSDLKFNSQSKNYTYTYKVENQTCDIMIKFFNKKVTNFKITYKVDKIEQGNFSMSYSYKEITPEIPDVD